jgi:hypothetical protein
MDIGLKRTLWKHVEDPGIERTVDGLERICARTPHQQGSSAHTLERTRVDKCGSNPFSPWIESFEKEGVVLLLLGLVPIFLRFLGLLGLS